MKLDNIENNINLFSEEITDIPLQFIFNLDEMGVQEWDDTGTKHLIVPSNYNLNSAP